MISVQRISQILNASQHKPGDTVTVGGWVRTVRHSKGGFSFISLNDGSCFDSLQVVADSSLGNYGDVEKLTTGSSLLASGVLVASQGRGQTVELQARSLTVYGYADAAAYPLQPKRHSFEFLRTQAHLRPRTSTFSAVARVRNRICSAIHEFFQQRGFIYVHTPLITTSDCEGAGEMFAVTTLDMDNPPRNEAGQVDYSQDFFARPTFLTVSGQLAVEPYACSLGNVYTFGPTFRAENSNTPRHLAEFWMVEPEMAFCDLEGDAAVAESFLKHIFGTVLADCDADMKFFDERINPNLLKTLEHITASNFERLTYTNAVEVLQAANRQWDFNPYWGCDLQTEHERYLTEEYLKKPVIVTDYPKSLKPFYMKCNKDDKTVAAMDVLVPGVGEIIGGSQREDNLDAIESRMAEMHMKKEDYWWYLDLRRFGSVPHAGFGLGLERTVQFCSGMSNIRDVIPYPRTPRNAEF
ncbi:MAG TPA: asparagine--tRNA ligase [Phycisphaerae bacterium]|nr:asparagine--tRNA ligase [Phycisphaerae bacterium]HPS52616.1 asparagine--tRNA ligase [Phycisphaerae bacterium]